MTKWTTVEQDSRLLGALGSTDRGTAAMETEGRKTQHTADLWDGEELLGLRNVSSLPSHNLRKTKAFM